MIAMGRGGAPNELHVLGTTTPAIHVESILWPGYVPTDSLEIEIWACEATI